MDEVVENTTTETPAETNQGEIAESTTLLEAAAEPAPSAEAAVTSREEQSSSEKVGAPEKYDEFVAPEGTELGSAVMTDFESAARELNLSQDAAQTMLNKVLPSMKASYEGQIETAKTTWAEASTADSEFGGDQLNQNVATAKKALDAYGSDNLRGLLNQTGLGNHPEVIRMLWKVGQTLSEDGVVNGVPAPAKEMDTAKRLFPNQN
jgi:hypothetical protein